MAAFKLCRVSQLRTLVLGCAPVRQGGISEEHLASREQVAAAKHAADQMLALTPECLKSGDWAKARPELEAQARAVLGRK